MQTCGLCLGLYIWTRTFVNSISHRNSNFHTITKPTSVILPLNIYYKFLEHSKLSADGYSYNHSQL